MNGFFMRIEYLFIDSDNMMHLCTASVYSMKKNEKKARVSKSVIRQSISATKTIMKFDGEKNVKKRKIIK